MVDIKVGDRVRIKDKPEWPGDYKMFKSEGYVIEVQEPWGYVIVHLEKTSAAIDKGTTLVFRKEEVEKI